MSNLLQVGICPICGVSMDGTIDEDFGDLGDGNDGDWAEAPAYRTQLWAN